MQRWVCLGFWQRKRVAQKRNKQEVLIAIVLGKIKKETAQTSRSACYFFRPPTIQRCILNLFSFFWFGLWGLPFLSRQLEVWRSNAMQFCINVGKYQQLAWWGAM